MTDTGDTNDIIIGGGGGHHKKGGPHKKPPPEPAPRHRHRHLPTGGGHDPGPKPPPPPPPPKKKGGGGGGPGGGGSSPPPPPPPTGQSQAKDRYASYLSIIEGWMGNDAITAAMIAFAHHAADRHWSTGTFLYFVRQTDWYKSYFKGIRPGMSEGQYNQAIDAYRKAAGSINFHITRSQAQFALTKNIPVQTFVDRVTAIQRVQSNWQFFQNFEQTLRAQGVIKPGTTVKKTDLYNFVMHRGPIGWDAVLNEAYARTAASEAGYHVGGNISRAEVMRIAETVGLDSTVHSEAGRYQLEQKLAGEYQKFGQVQEQFGKGSVSTFIGEHLTRQEQEALAFGGPKANRAAAKAQSILDQYKEAIKSAVQPQLVETTEGAKIIGGLEGLHPQNVSPA